MFRTPNFEKLRSNLKQAVIFDGCNLCDLQEIVKEGFYYSK